MRKPYFIWAPSFDNASGGIVVMHRMAVELQKRGECVYINTPVQNKKWDMVLVMEDGIPESIAVYPEIIQGNPFGAETVVRYLLNIPGVCGGPNSLAGYSDTDFFFIYSQIYNSKIGLPEEDILFCPHLELDRFYDKHIKRCGRMVYRGKGTQPDHPLCNYPLLGKKEGFRGEDGQDKLCDLLNKCELLYVYDNCTAMTDIARLCGCPVVIIPDGSYTKEQISVGGNWEAGGIGWGVEEAAIARYTIDSQKIRAGYQYAEIEFQKRLTRFIEVTQNGK
jgi:hypothetical protein